MSPLSLDGRGPGGAGADDGADALIEVVSVAGGSTNGGSGVVIQSTGIEDGGNPAAAAEADADADLLRVALDEALATLLPREQFVLRHRFGLASASARALACSSTGDGTPPGWLQASSADEAEAMVAAEGKEGASRPLLGSLLGVSAETVRTIERRGLAKLKQPSRAGAVLAHVDDETRTRMEQSDGGLFAAALAEAAEKADRRAGGGRVFGAFAGGAVPASALGGKTSKRTGVYSEADAKRGRRAPRRGKKVPRPASAKKQGSTRGLPAEKERTSDGEKREGKREQKETEKEKEKEVIAIRSA
jgi:DNA-binding CsgD family transcriptional regulator